MLVGRAKVPYIKQERRNELKPVIDSMIQNGVKPNGELNYLLFAFVTKTIFPSYNNYKEVIGELHCAITEIERRFLAPYEEEKMKINGDVS